MAADGSEQIGMSITKRHAAAKNEFWIEHSQQAPLTIAFRVVGVRSPDVILRLTDNARLQRRLKDHRLNQSLPHGQRDSLVTLKDLILAITFIPAEEFVATVAGKQNFHAVVARQLRAPVGRN